MNDEIAEMDGKKRKQPIIQTSKLIYNGELLEQVYNPERKTSYYLRWVEDTQEAIIMDKVEDGGKLYIPINDELLSKKVVLLPSNVMDYGTEENLELEINAFIEAWLDVSEEHRQKATWYIMLSWIIDKLHTIPYLRALGDYGTGKTRYLDVIGGICYKSMFVGGAVRSAPIYRVIDKWRGTAIFDEFTLTKSDETEDIIQILNNGYQREKAVLRCDQGSFNVRAFDPFGAKILATRKIFYDNALESRCITEIMQLTDRNDVPIDLTSEFFKQRAELQNKLLMYRFKNWNEINPDETINIDFGNVLPRIKQSFMPFTVLFQYDTKKLEWFINQTQKYNRKIIEENSSSFDGQIFNHYIQLIEQHNVEQQTIDSDDYKPAVITSGKIRDCMIEDGWKDTLTSAKIGRRLKTLGFEIEFKYIAGKTARTLKIDENKLRRLRRRYDITAITDITEHTEQKNNNNNNESTGLDV